MYFKEELERIGRDLAERKYDLLQELESLPDGEFLCTDSNGYRRYLQRLPAKGNRKKEHRYGIKKKPEMIKGLVRKEYVTGALKVIDCDIEVVDQAIKMYKPIDENTIMKEFTEKYPELKSGIYGRQYNIEEWKNEFGRIESYHPENLIHTAVDGTPMRSKNELFIASRLDHYGIDYRSDCPTGIPGLRRVPDFTIIRKRDGKIIYWEHCGMMDDMEYRIDNQRKLEEYEAAGIVPWENLIITYDTKKGGLRADIIEAMIRCWLL